MECISGFEKNFRHYRPAKHKREDSFNQNDAKKTKQESNEDENSEKIKHYDSNRYTPVKVENNTSNTLSRVSDMTLQEPGPSSQLAPHLPLQNMPFSPPSSNYLTMEEINNIINQTHGRVQFVHSDRRPRESTEPTHGTSSTETNDQTFGRIPFVLPVETYPNTQTPGAGVSMESSGGYESESEEDDTKR